MVARRVSVALLLGACLAASCAGGLVAPASASAARCGGVLAHRSRPPVESFDPHPGAPRVFAMQYKQEARSVVSYASFRRKIECMLRVYVVPHLAIGRPNVVVFNEDIGLGGLAIGSRGRVARDVIARRGGPNCRAGAEPCGVLGPI